MNTGRMVLRLATVATSLTLAAGFVAYQSGCSWFRGKPTAAAPQEPAADTSLFNDIKPVSAPTAQPGERMLMAGSKSAPVFARPQPAQQPQKILMSSSKSADITRGGSVGFSDASAQQSAAQQAATPAASQPAQAVQQRAANQPAANQPPTVTR